MIITAPEPSHADMLLGQRKESVGLLDRSVPGHGQANMLAARFTEVLCHYKWPILWKLAQWTSRTPGRERHARPTGCSLVKLF